MIERVTYTTQPSAQSMGRYITVYAPDGSYVSRHINMEECTESALAHAQANEISGTYRFVPPEKHMSVQIIKTVPGVYAGSFIANPPAGRVNATGNIATWNNQNPGAGQPWDIWGARTAPAEFSSLAWPTQPTTSTTQTVSSLSALNTAISGGGQNITLQPGAYSGTLNLGGVTDCRITLTGCTITGTIGWLSSTARVEIIGGRFEIGGSEQFADGTDIRFDNVFINKTSGSGGTLILATTLTRFAATNSSFYASSGNGSLFNDPGPSDIIFAGCDFYNTTPGGSTFGIRYQGVQRLVVVDTRTYIAGTNQNFRLHAPTGVQDMDPVYIARCQIEGEEVTINPDIGGATTGFIRNLYFYDNNLYHPSGLAGFQPIQIGLGTSGGNVSNLNFADNTDYTADVGGGIINNGSGVALSEDSNNVKATYISTPAFAYGSDQ